MRIKRFVFPLLYMAVTPVFAEGSQGDVSGKLFQHVLNGNSLDIFPFIPPVLLPFGISVHLLMLLLSAAVIIIAFWISFRQPSLKPRGLALALETVVLFVRDDIVYPIMGKKRGEKRLLCSYRTELI